MNPGSNTRTPAGKTTAGTRTLKVAVVGCGSIGPNHAKAYAATGKTELVGVADIVLDRATSFGERFDGAPTYASLDELLAAQKPDLVSIATPPGTHAALACAVLAAGAQS